MSKEWKPGDVAALRINAKDVIGLARDHKDEPGLVWVISGHEFYKSIAVNNNLLISEARPLVVIDPDSGDVDRLVETMRRHGWTGLNDEALGDMQAALREFANPTPPRCEARLTLSAVTHRCDRRTGHDGPHDNDDVAAAWGDA